MCFDYAPTTNYYSCQMFLIVVCSCFSDLIAGCYNKVRIILESHASPHLYSPVGETGPDLDQLVLVRGFQGYPGTS